MRGCSRRLTRRSSHHAPLSQDMLWLSRMGLYTAVRERRPLTLCDWPDLELGPSTRIEAQGDCDLI